MEPFKFYYTRVYSLISELSLSNCRTIKTFDKKFSEGITVISGKNGSGKTTILESIFLLAAGYSFKTRDLTSLLSWKESSCIFRSVFTAKDYSSTRALQITPDKITIKKDNESVRSVARFFGDFPIIIMQPSDIELVKGSPEMRRRYLDEILCFSGPFNADLLRRYKRILLQRNEWLHNYKLGQKESEAVFTVLSEQLAQLASQIWQERFALFEKLAFAIPKYYSILSGGNDFIFCKYKSSVSFKTEDFNSEFLFFLEQRKEYERRLGVTLAGPHKDDFILSIKDHELKAIGSQGQCRSAAIAMRLSALNSAKETKNSPILLLDDILAELDSERQKAVSSVIKEKEAQVFIATPHLRDIPFTPDDCIHLE